jgi:hypothetical protein
LKKKKRNRCHNEKYAEIRTNIESDNINNHWHSYLNHGLELRNLFSIVLFFIFAKFSSKSSFRRLYKNLTEIICEWIYVTLALYHLLISENFVLRIKLSTVDYCLCSVKRFKWVNNFRILEFSSLNSDVRSITYHILKKEIYWKYRLSHRPHFFMVRFLLLKFYLANWTFIL